MNKLVLGLLFLLTLAFAAGCYGGDNGASASKSASSVAQAAAIDIASLNEAARQPVEVQEVEPRTFTVRASYTGALQPKERVTLKAEIEGTVEQLQFEEGHKVSRGAELVRIDTRQLEVRRDQARSDLKLAESEFQSARTLEDKGLIATSELDQVLNRRDVAVHALKNAEIELEKSVVRAPAGGLVNTRAVAVGEYLSKGQLIAEILVVHKLRARIAVPETELRFFRAGKTVDVHLDAHPGQRFGGEVVTVGAEAHQESRTFPIDVEIDNAEGRLRAGMLARVTAELATHENGILVPRHAILEREQGRVAFIAKDGHAQARAVKTGAAVGEDVQVLEGLAAGEQLIVTGQQRLGANELIKIVNAAR